MGLARSTYYDLPARAADGIAIVEAVFAVCDAFEPPMAVSPPRQQGLVLDVQPKARRRSVITPTAIMTARSSPIWRNPPASANLSTGRPGDRHATCMTHQPNTKVEVHQ